ncbi:hypothetical protein B296_00046477 [Ensete ventricosum]|uniref:SOSEKI DIX-like domain-containing protein n=1 Tax=Ensete ventricosum TaxID=4639 RepID=A0A426WYQ3_ENSVE|nr:hypothetical protein B296_00046477 [Ensete ventricosum]
MADSWIESGALSSQGPLREDDSWKVVYDVHFVPSLHAIVQEDQTFLTHRCPDKELCFQLRSCGSFSPTQLLSFPVSLWISRRAMAALRGRMEPPPETSPERTKAWKETRPRRVPVVYYLSRNGQLEHPHFMEVTLSSCRGLFLRGIPETKRARTIVLSRSQF